MKLEIGKQYCMVAYDSYDEYYTLVIPIKYIRDGILCLIWNQWKNYKWIKTKMNLEYNDDFFVPTEDFYREWYQELPDIISTLFEDIKKV